MAASGPNDSSAAAATAPADHSPLSVVWKVWKEFDLDSMRVRLDESGMKVATHQEEAVQNRRKLAEATRDFRKTAVEATSKPVGALLKLYQEEIDRLTKRAKHGESAFLDVYQKLYEAPDPAPALATAFETASRAADLEAQVRKLGSELAEYKAESTQIKNQDHSIRKLEEKVRALESELEDRAGELVDAREAAVAEADAARLVQMQEREAELSSALGAAHASLAAVQKLHASTQNQLFAIQSASEEERAGRQSEVEFAAVELERAQERLAALERDKARLEARSAAEAAAAAAHAVAGGAGAAAPPPLGGGGGPGVEEALRAELSTSREIVSRLRSEVASLRREAERSGGMWEARAEGLRAALAATEQHAEALEEELRVRPTNAQMDVLRQQLRVLRALEHNALDLDDPSAAPGGGGANGDDGRGAGAAASLEAVLLQRNRHLEHELTMSKLRVVEGRQDVDKATAAAADLEAQLADKQLLVDRLEEDLMAARADAEAGAGAGGSGRDGRDASGSKLTGLIGGDDQDGDSSMVRVVCGQRDRLRAKVQELEEAVTRARTELSAARNEAAAARADNMALVERLRFLHGYKQKGSGPASSSGTPAGGVGDVEAGVSAERKYGRLYDEGINPFREFQGGERDRSKKQMGLPDKVMYMFGQLVFGSQSARLFTFGYLAIMHLLVFASLTRMTHHSSGQLYEHHQHLVDGSHAHDVTAALHHGAHGAVSVAKAVVGALAPTSRQRLP